MNETERERQEVIDDLKGEVIDYITEIWNEVYNLTYRDGMYDNTISEHIVFECNSLTRTLDKARRRLDNLNGKDSGNYPWA